MLHNRMVIGWSNAFRIRSSVLKLFGYDPVIYSTDQKPFHFDESGSKNQKTLGWTGQQETAIKENHGATRSRWTSNTLCTSDVEKAKQIPFVELMFAGGEKLSTDLQRLVDELRADGHGYLSIVTSDSGSYRTGSVFDYLEKMLDPMVPGRDIRILAMDTYKSHLDDAIKRLGWQRGYIVLYQGGGTTGVGQVNGTDLHQPLSVDYCTKI